MDSGWLQMALMQLNYSPFLHLPTQTGGVNQDVEHRGKILITPVAPTKAADERLLDMQMIDRRSVVTRLLTP